MFCNKCGKEFSSNIKYCTRCGKIVKPPSFILRVIKERRYIITGISIAVLLSVAVGTALGYRSSAVYQASKQPKQSDELSDDINTIDAITVPEQHPQQLGTTPDLPLPQTPTSPSLDTTQQKVLELLNNFTKVDCFGHVKQYDGTVYASEFICIPEWTAVSGSMSLLSYMAVVGDYIYYIKYDATGVDVGSLWRSDLDGGNLIEIANNICAYTPKFIAEGKIIYGAVEEELVTEHFDNSSYQYLSYEHQGTFSYCTNTSQTVRLSDDAFYWLSYDEEYIYYQMQDAKDIWRVRWNGTYREVMDELILPYRVMFVEGEYFYTLDGDSFWNYSVINRYSNNNSNESDSSYTIPDGLWFLTLHDEWAYFGGEEGIIKVNMDAGNTVKLADLPSGYTIPVPVFRTLIGDYLFISIFFDMDEDWEYIRLYKLPLTGGVMEYQNVKWYES